MHKSIIFTALSAVALALGSCDNVSEYVAPQPYQIDWKAVADSSTTAFIQNFWNDSEGFFNAKSTGYAGETNNYWPQAHAMDVVIDAFLRTGDNKYSAMFPKWLEGIKKQCWGGHSGYRCPLYDDEAWISLTMVRLYQITGDDKYLNVAKDLHADIMKAWKDDNVGGLPWGSDKAYENNRATPTNGPACLLGYKLYEATGDAAYAEAGLKVYGFLRTHIIDPGTGRVWNGIDAGTLAVEGEDSRVYSYNHGTVMASAYATYQYTGDEVYLKDARRIASYAVNKAFVDRSTNILHYENYDWRWDDDGGDVTLFRAILFHYLTDIIEAPEVGNDWKTKFFSSMDATAQALWRQGVLDKSDYSRILYNSNLTKGVAVGETGYLNPNVTGAACIEMRARLAESLKK